MSSYRDESSPDNFRSGSDDREINGAQYDSRDQQSHGHYRLPPHQQHTQVNLSVPPRGPMNHHNDRRGWNNQPDYDHYNRGRNLASNGRGRYRDRDQEGYRSPPRYNRRSRSRSRSPPRRHANTRSRSPYYGGAPSREIHMEGLPYDMSENDVGITLSPPDH